MVNTRELHSHVDAAAAQSSAVQSGGFERELAETWSDLKTGSKLMGEVAKGAVKELEHHPLQVATSVAEGAVAGAVVACLAPEVAIGLTVGAAAIVGVELGQNVPKWAHDAVVVGNPEQFSRSDYAKADKRLQDLGANALENAAMVAGGWTGSTIRPSLRAFNIIGKDAVTGFTASIAKEVMGLNKLTPAVDAVLYESATTSTIYAVRNFMSLSDDKRSR